MKKYSNTLAIGLVLASITLQAFGKVDIAILFGILAVLSKIEVIAEVG